MAKDGRSNECRFGTVPVQSSNRMQFLEQGKIDMMIATMSDRVDRQDRRHHPAQLLHRHQYHVPRLSAVSSWKPPKF